MIAPPQVHAQSFAKAIRTDIFVPFSAFEEKGGCRSGNYFCLFVGIIKTEESYDNNRVNRVCRPSLQFYADFSANNSEAFRNDTVRQVKC